MASVPPDPVPLLVSLKAVDPAEYPYYGNGGAGAGDELAAGARRATRRWWRMSFSIRLNAHVGQTLRLGGRNFRIAAVLKQEPDRISAGAGMGPRVMISQAALERTGLLAPGSRASQRLLVKLPAKPPRTDGDATPPACASNWKTALPRCAGDGFSRGQSGADRGPR